MRLRLVLGMVLALCVGASQLAAFAITDDQATAEQPADQSQDQDQEDQQVPVLKAPVATLSSSVIFTPFLARPTWELPTVALPMAYPRYGAVPLASGSYFRTLFRQIISPNAP